MKSILLKSLSFLISLLEKICFLFILILVFSLLLQFLDNLRQYPAAFHAYTFVEKTSAPVISGIKAAIPYTYQGVDYSKVILIVLLFILARIFSFCNGAVETVLHRMREKEEYLHWRKRMENTLPKEKISEMDTKFEVLNTSTRNRKELLKEFATLKNQLDSMGQYLAFLAIDVVDSTGMKRDEDKHLAAYAFDKYNQIVSACLRENGVVKYAMTPDGIMSCFKTGDNAVKAAVDLIDRLKVFNKKDKEIKRDFEVRCGINTGFVYIDEDTPLEQVTDRTIDIAGHMQKHAKPNCINIAGSAIEPLIHRDGFNKTTEVIDEQIVYEWKKE